MSDTQNLTKNEQKEESLELKKVEEGLKHGETENGATDFGFHSETEVLATGIFLGLLPSTYDIVTDVLMINSFLTGADYLHTVNEPNNSEVEGCVFIKNSSCTHFSLNDGISTTTTFTFSCFETDPIFGWVSLAFMFLPALKLARSELFKCFIKIIFFFTFPLALLFVKIVNLFNKDPKWKEWSELMGLAEGKFESKYQICLQLFIVFTMAHRQPSGIQLASMLGSILMITKMTIEEQIKKERKHEKKSLEERIGTFVSFVPYFAFVNTATSLTLALQVALLRYNFMWVVVFAVVMAIMEGLIKKTGRIEIPSIPFMPTTGYLTMDFAKFIIPDVILVIFTILANLNYDHVMSTFYPFVPASYTLSSMPIISDIQRFNILVAVIFSLQFISYVLWYFQIRKTREKECEE